MNELKRILRWSLATLLVVTFAIPWFLWRNDTVVSGLPVWLWWHIGWLGLTAVFFAVLWYVIGYKQWLVGVYPRAGPDRGCLAPHHSRCR